MTIFRWVIGVVSALLFLGMSGAFGLYMAFEGELWLERTRRLRHWLYLVCLLWFNTEIWGRVVYTLFHWNK